MSDGIASVGCVVHTMEKKATAILLEFPDSHVRNTVITCGLVWCCRNRLHLT
eukprot:m.311182 g.311182  ORF g.311182 m.311182 type:complete len:52 (+) comp20216_c0_seq29:180-335(+)